MKYYYLLTINLQNIINEKTFINRLDKALDWIQIMPGVFLIESSSDIVKWQERLMPILNKNQFFIVKIDLKERKGWMASSTWEWINSRK